MLEVQERATRRAGRLASLLLVEDDRASAMVMQARLEALGYAVETATNGAEAFALLRESPAAFDVVITDRMMPVLDGLGLTRRIKREAALKSIPVVLLTGANEQTDISAGIDAGAFYYLVKPPSDELLSTVLRSAMKEVERLERSRAELRSHQSAFRNMQAVRFTLRLPSEVEATVSLLASMLEAPDKTIQGIYELVQNSIEHGVYRFGFDEKGRLMKEQRFDQVLAERAADPTYRNGLVEATAIRRDDGVYIGVKDNGPGFDFKRWLATDPSRSLAPNGRGIARAANVSFDSLQYDDMGTRVVAFVASKPKVRW